MHLITLSSVGHKPISYGAQNVFCEKDGSHTGETSLSMLKDAGVSHIILGHSERRAKGETSEDVQKKISLVLKEKLIPILCIGEAERDMEGEYLSVIKNEIKDALKDVSQANVKKIVIAYEPVWAIGKTGEEAITGRDLHEMTLYIRKVLSDLYNQRTAFSVPVLYGGSVTGNNAKDIFSEGEVQGFLVGRASLDAKEFGKIISIVNKA